ncbi:helix-turn-helix domain-containing protein [Solicola gregarius]|uniref:Helix-turn-helix domain-containing protein n=1 Tax=Solicola gregarius TaxID=2908642 RepID=A0AA46TLG4_9ACTN|nr:helix-turn-helix domain-containing protein [Solicola gregarius]UYM07494.1 helix-turn-helix domain-containing protein [Solicola gregarius]
MTSNRRSHRVAVLAYEGMSLFETGIVTEVFGVRWPDLPEPWYDLTLCSERRGATPTVGGATLRTSMGLDGFEAADTIIVPSVSDVDVPTSPRLVAALRAAHERGVRIASICSGAFALAGAGLLDGRGATTHWIYAERLAERFPAVEVDPRPLFVDEGDLLTSAGSAAGLDLCLHLVRRDHGGAVANRLARRLVAQPYRDGGQAQYIESPVRAADSGDDIARSMAWALERLDEPLTMEALATSVHLSPRTYLRHFTAATGTSPIRWLIAQRVEASLALLETTSMPIEEVAAAVGFQSAVTYRHHFAAALKIAPSAYRRSFRGARAG